MYDVKGMDRFAGMSGDKKELPGSKTGKSAFGWLWHFQLGDGTYKFRLLPPEPTKCPRGWVPDNTHVVEVKMGEEPERVPCSGNIGEDCYLCEIVEAIAEMGESTWNAIPVSLQEVLKQMQGQQKILLPTLWKMTGVERADGERTLTDYHPSDETVGKRFVVMLDRPSIYNAIKTIITEDPSVCCADERGSWLYFEKRGRKYNIRKGKQAALQGTELELLKKYPQMVPDRDKFWDYTKAEAKVKSSWYAKKLAEFVDLDG